MKNWKPALLAALILQVWSMVSWMALPWHMATFKTPVVSSELSTELRKSMPEDGVYVLPGRTSKDWAEHQKAMRAGPVALMFIQPNGVDPGMGAQMLLGFLMNLISAWAVLWVLTQLKPKSLKQRVLLGTLIPGIGIALVTFGYWNWWRAPSGYSVVGLLDGVVGWALASLVLKPAKGA